MKYKHPLQPVIWDGTGVIRFQSNPIVRYLLDWARVRGLTLNELTVLSYSTGWTHNDWEQFSQLIGYSISGWGDLSYVRDTTYAKAQSKVAKLCAKYPTDPELSTEDK